VSRSPSMTWFVSYKPRQQPIRGYRRLSAKFASEQEARLFAQLQLREGADITAGTINPHSPKRYIGSAAIPDWIGAAESAA
jgi:hypothetical protein